ncbi:MAG TPA: hypothetical protein PKC43_06400 [Phycisphaerales bacterium]|nr:hypothetical protein [Phycisphaerales bacterium]HMP37063.1 hypothetical protein [Phycisphaerales bacterium]
MSDHRITITPEACRLAAADVWLRLSYVELIVRGIEPGPDRDMILRDLVEPMVRSLAEWCSQFRGHDGQTRDRHEEHVRRLAAAMERLGETPSDVVACDLRELAGRHRVTPEQLLIAAVALDPERGLASESALLDLDEGDGARIAAMLRELAERLMEAAR